MFLGWLENPLQGYAIPTAKRYSCFDSVGSSSRPDILYRVFYRHVILTETHVTHDPAQLDTQLP